MRRTGPLIAAVMLGVVAATAQQRRSIDSVLDTVDKVHAFQETALPPDGKRIAVLYVAGSAQATGALVAYKPDAGVVGDVVEEQRIAIVDPAKPNSLREVSPANLFVYDYDWSPDGTRFAAEAVEGSGTNNYWIARLYTIRADTGEAKSIWKPPLQIAVPRWSPDGRWIAVLHGVMSGE